MMNLTNVLWVLTGVLILLMPIWIIASGRAPWSQLARKVIMSCMILVSTFFAMVVILKPTANHIVGAMTNLLILFYWLLVWLAAYKNWPDKKNS